MAGYDNSGAKYVAKVWKNGKELYSLTDGSQDASASSVFVVGADVYTAGGESNGTNWVAKVWKNDGEHYELTWRLLGMIRVFDRRREEYLDGAIGSV